MARVIKIKADEVEHARQKVRNHIELNILINDFKNVSKFLQAITIALTSETSAGAWGQGAGRYSLRAGWKVYYLNSNTCELQLHIWSFILIFQFKVDTLMLFTRNFVLSEFLKFWVPYTHVHMSLVSAALCFCAICVCVFECFCVCFDLTARGNIEDIWTWGWDFNSPLFSPWSATAGM